MDFSIVKTPAVTIDEHYFAPRKSISASGEIRQGDAARLEKIIDSADRDFFGNVTIFLNSPGGDVEAALSMVRVMDAYEVTTIVDKGAICASACSSILYISGRFHTILEGGLLGFHACRAGDKVIPLCAEVVSNNATKHATAFGAVEMWMRDNKDFPGGLFWFDRQTACRLGLCGPPSFEYVLAVPSFDCGNAKLEAEQAICEDRRLARYEASLSINYNALKRLLSPSEWIEIRESQREWLIERNKCGGNKNCLLRKISQRRFLFKSYRNGLIINSFREEFFQSAGEEAEALWAVYGAILEKCDKTNECEKTGGFDETHRLFNDFTVIRSLECSHELGDKDLSKGENMSERLDCLFRSSDQILSIKSIR
jgi:hypothetical protein